MIETFKTNPNCEIKPSNCEYAVQCTTYEDLAGNKEVYACGRDNCKKGLGDKSMEKSKIVETVQKLEEELSVLTDENKRLRNNNELLEEQIATLRTRCTDSARDMFDKKMYGCLSVVRGRKELDCGLNFDSPLDFAKSIIEHKTVVDGWTIEAEGFSNKVPTHERVTFGYDELIEIAEYLLIYCKHNREDFIKCHLKNMY